MGCCTFALLELEKPVGAGCWVGPLMAALKQQPQGSCGRTAGRPEKTLERPMGSDLHEQGAGVAAPRAGRLERVVALIVHRVDWEIGA